MKFSKAKITYIFIGIILFIFIALSGRIWETNDIGHVQVKQAWWTGEQSVRTSPGTYYQGFGEITDYLYSDAIYLSAEDLDGGEGADTKAIPVLFPDGSCDIDFVGQYEVRADHATWLKIKERYSTQKALKSMIRQQVIEVITNTASLMNAEEAYSSKRADFIRLCRDQIIHGLYKPTYTIILDTIQGNQIQEIRKYDVKTKNGDPDGEPLIAKEPLLGEYDIVFSQFNIKRLHNFDSKTVELIEKRKEAKAAQQSAITEKAKGEASIAKEKATQEAIKIKEVTQAEKLAAVAVIDAKKKFEVAEYAAKEAEQEKLKKIQVAKGVAEELKIADGLSEREKFVITQSKERDIGVAQAMKDWVGPQFVVVGGKDGKGESNIENTLMLQMMQKLVNEGSTMPKVKK